MKVSGLVFIIAMSCKNCNSSVASVFIRIPVSAKKSQTNRIIKAIFTSLWLKTTLEVRSKRLSAAIFWKKDSKAGHAWSEFQLLSKAG